MTTAITTAVLIVLALPTAAFAQNPAPQTGSAQHAWQASKLLHLNVYSGNKEKIGEIKDLMLDDAGNVQNVVISVGGFLGMGQHDVAVKFDQLTWISKPVPAAAPPITGSGPATTGINPGPIPNPGPIAAPQLYPDRAQLNLSNDEIKALPPFDYTK